MSLEIIPEKEANKEPVPFYRKSKTAVHVTVKGKGKIAQLTKQNRKKK